MIGWMLHDHISIRVLIVFVLVCAAGFECSDLAFVVELLTLVVGCWLGLWRALMVMSQTKHA